MKKLTYALLLVVSGSVLGSDVITAVEATKAGSLEIIGNSSRSGLDAKVTLCKEVCQNANLAYNDGGMFTNGNKAYCNCSNKKTYASVARGATTASAAL